MTYKSDLRKNLRYDRQAFVKSQISSQQLFNDGIAALAPLISRSTSVAVYDSFGSEVSVAAIISLANEMEIALALPFIDEAHRRMQFKRWAPGDPLFDQAFGFRQPASDAADVKPDLILTPLIGFDRDMNRLGQGGGFYDRYLSCNNNAIKIGIGWSCQEVASIPADGWDVKLDAILTEKEWIVGANSVIAL